MKLFYIKFLFISLVAATSISCEKDNNEPSAPSLENFIKADANLSMFSKAIDKAGLESFKTGPGPFTWFAPTNDAFAAAGITEDSLNKMTPGKVNYLMMYHLINTSLSGENMIAVNSAPRTTQLGAANQIYFATVNGETYINGNKIISRDNKVENGYVHIINKILVPPVLRGNIQGILNSTGQHTLFIQALTRAGLWASFGTTAVSTVFAPTDAAMTAAGYTSSAISAATVSSLAAAMRYHFISNLRLFTNDLIRTSLPATAAGSNQYLIPSDNGTKIKGKANASAVNIVRPDLLGTNCVVHVIDGFLRP